MFFSGSTLGFYQFPDRPGVPVDVVEISEEQWHALRLGQSQGKVLRADDDGFPVLIDSPVPDPQIAINSAALAYLSTTDWYVARLQETGEPIPADVLIKRADARKAVVR